MNLVEGGLVGAQPRVLHAVVTVVEHLAVHELVRVVTVLEAGTVELRLLQQYLETVGLLLVVLVVVHGPRAVVVLLGHRRLLFRGRGGPTSLLLLVLAVPVVWLLLLLLLVL